MQPAPRSAPGDGRHDRQRLARRDRRIEAVEETHVLVGHEEIDEAAERFLCELHAIRPKANSEHLQ